MTLREIIAAFIAFREEVITRRTSHLLGKARDRAHVLLGLSVAVANLDEVIALIRNAPDPATARAGLVGRAWPAADVAPLVALVGEPGREVAADGTYRLSEEQARAILDLRLQRLTGLEREKIAEELRGLITEIAGYLEILRSRVRLFEVLRGELLDIKERFATPRRTAIEDVEFEADIEALIQREAMVVTVSHAGYIKRVPLSTYRAQRRGGRGRAGMAIREEDFLSEVFVASTLAPVLFFTSSGRVYKLKVYRLPLGTPQSRGRPMVNLLPNLAPGETISTVMPLPEDEESWSDLTVMFATANGYVRRNALQRFRRCPRQRQNRDEIRGRGRRRPADRRRDLHRRQRRAARHPQRQIDPLSGRRCTGLLRPLARSGCAASGCSATIRSSRCRSCATRRSPPMCAMPI